MGDVRKPSATRPKPLPPGSAIDGRYQVRALIGRGGTAAVYATWDAVLERAVAVKLVTAPPTMTVLERLRREAALARELDHPAIVPVLDVVDDTAPPYLVMELLEGTSLKVIVEREGRWPLHRVVEVLEPIAAAVDAIHSAGFVHRDIKPSNIVFATRARDTPCQPMLVDLGIATSLDARWSRLTDEDVLIGTPTYVAPELVGARGRPDRRCDIYSLAVVAFRLYTGRVPIVGDSVGATLARKTAEDAPRASTLQGGVPAAVDAALAAGLSRNMDDRPPTATKLVERLRFGCVS